MSDNNRDVIELLDDSSSSDGSACMLSSGESDSDRSLPVPDGIGSWHPSRHRQALGNSSKGAATRTHSTGRNQQTSNQPNWWAGARHQAAASPGAKQSYAAIEGATADSAIYLNSDGSDSLSVHTHVELSSGDEVLDDVSVINVSEYWSSSEDDAEIAKDEIIADHQKPIARKAEYDKIGPRKTPHMGTLSGNFAVATSKRGRDKEDDHGPPTKRRPRPAIGFDDHGMPLAPCRICSKLLSKEIVRDHETMCGDRAYEAAEATAQSATEATAYTADETVSAPKVLGSPLLLVSARNERIADLSFSLRESRAGTLETESRRATKSDSREREGWKHLVQKTMLAVQEDEAKMKAETLRIALQTKNEMLLATKDRMSKRKLQPVLRYVKGESLDPAHLYEADHPLPEDKVATVFLQSNFGEFGDDSKSNLNADEHAVRRSPYVVDGETSNRGRPRYKAEERINRVKSVLQRLWTLVLVGPSVVFAHLSELLNEDIACVEKVADGLRKTGPEKRNLGTYDAAMSSFRELLCTRCCRYDCGLHGLADEYSSCLAAEVAMKKEESGFWKVEEPLICLPAVDSNEDITLSKEEKAIAEKLCYIYENDLDKVAVALGIPKHSIQKQIILKTVEFQYTNMKRLDLSIFHSKKRKNKRRTHNLFAREHSNRQGGRLFFPCHHTEPCSKETCTCVQNGYPCTNQCIWGPLSRNFFPGCNCKSKCTTNSCPCFAGGRECDPDRCRSCQTCTDPPGNLQNKKQFCRNDNIRMRRHKHVLLAKSTIPGAGWGLFCKSALRKGDYIHEYVGEVIKDEEAKVKGIEYDKENRNYLFEISSDYCVDGLRKSNKTRFMNHSPKPNVIVKMTTVNGDPRIAFYAKEEIPAEAELFFDYGNQYFSIKSEFAKKQPSPKKKYEDSGNEKLVVHA